MAGKNKVFPNAIKHITLYTLKAIRDIKTYETEGNATPMKSPKVTVMMPVYNAEKYLARAIQSVLGQNFFSFELIIYDDGSSDGSYSIAEKYSRQDSRIRLMRSRVNRGVSYARNKILWAARGEYIAPQDADDIMMQFRLKQLSRFLDGHPEIGVVFGSVYWHEGRKTSRIFRPWTRTSEEQIFFSRSQKAPCFPWFHHGASLFRRKLALKIGGYSCRLKTSEDLDLFFRLFKKTDFFYLNRLYYIYRDNSNGISTRHRSTVAARQQEFEKKCTCELFKIGQYRIRIFFDQSDFYQKIKINFIKGNLFQAYNETVSSRSKRKMTFQLKKTTGREDGLDLELLLPEMSALRKEGYFSLARAWCRKVTVYHLPDAVKRMSPGKLFEQCFMKPLQIIMASPHGAIERGGLVSKNGDGLVILKQKETDDNWTISFLRHGYQYLSHDYFFLQAERDRCVAHGLPTRIPIKSHERRQLRGLGNFYWDKCRKKYYFEPDTPRAKKCLVKTVIFPRQYSKKGFLVKRLSQADFKRRLLAEKHMCLSSPKRTALPLLLNQAKAFEIACGNEDVAKNAEQILFDIKQKST